MNPCTARFLGFGAAVTVVVALVGVAATAAASTAGSFAAVGGFEVHALVQGEWEVVGDLHFGRFERVTGILLPPGATSGAEVRVRLVQRGGGAAFIDAVTLNGRPDNAVSGLAEPSATALLAARDLDLADASARTVELSFQAPKGAGELRVVARVEEGPPHGSPFSFPFDNLFRRVTETSSFYRYDLQPGGHTLDWPAALDSEGALFAEWCEPTSGHPDGTTYGWVTNDDANLYVAVDFTPDNTCDGDKDWAAVWIKRDGVPREFRVSEAATRWGRPSFVPTSRAAYRHKLYTFEIPLEELGIENIADAGPLEMAFEAYGTVAITFGVLPSLWDFGPVLVGDTAPLQTFTVTAPPTGLQLPTNWLTRSGPDSGSFPLTPGTCFGGLTLAPGQTCTFQIGFTPSAAGSYQDSVLVSGFVLGAGTFVVPVSLLGQGVEPIPAVSGGAIALLIGAFVVAAVLALRRFL